MINSRLDQDAWGAGGARWTLEVIYKTLDKKDMLNFAYDALKAPDTIAIMLTRRDVGYRRAHNVVDCHRV
jgi:hypothetical protein